MISYLQTCNYQQQQNIKPSIVRGKKKGQVSFAVDVRLYSFFKILTKSAKLKDCLEIRFKYSFKVLPFK